MRRMCRVARAAAFLFASGWLIVGGAAAMPRLPVVFQRIIPQVHLQAGRPAQAPTAPGPIRQPGVQLRLPVVGSQIRWMPSSIRVAPSPIPVTDSAAGVDPKHGSDLAFHLPVWTLGF